MVRERVRNVLGKRLRHRKELGWVKGREIRGKGMKRVKENPNSLFRLLQLPWLLSKLPRIRVLLLVLLLQGLQLLLLSHQLQFLHAQVGRRYA